MAGKKLRSRSANIDRHQAYPLPEAIKLACQMTSERFDETLDIAIRLGVDPRHADQQVRGMVSLPKGTGKTCKVAVFAKGEKANQATAAGADIVGSSDLAEKIQAGFMDFDVCIASPDQMPLVGRLGRILGPHNLMPNPKLGTVTVDVADAVTKAKAGQVLFRAEKNGIVHALVGKASFSVEDLIENIKTFYQAIVSAKPAGAKGTYIKFISLASTQGPRVAVDISSFRSS